MVVTLLPKYSGLLYLVATVTTLINGAQGNTKPVMSVPEVLNGGVVPEDVALNIPVATFTASDSGDTFQCGGVNSDFGVAAGDRGILHEFNVITNRKYDFEQQEKITVTIVCNDSGTPSLSASVSFELTISDVNEAPKFIFPKVDDAEAMVYTKSALTEQYITVTAKDEDTGDAGKLTYTFNGAQYPALFSIATTDANLGKITIKKAPKATEPQSYTVTIRATDMGTPTMAADSVPLTIKFIDDYIPANGQVSYNSLVANLIFVTIISLLYFML